MGKVRLQQHQQQWKINDSLGGYGGSVGYGFFHGFTTTESGSDLGIGVHKSNRRYFAWDGDGKFKSVFQCLDFAALRRWMGGGKKYE